MTPDWSDEHDPIPFADLNNPQSLNVYGYVYNNPLAEIDEDGHDPEPAVNCPLLCRLRKWLQTPSNLDQALSGANKEIGNTFQYGANLLNRELGGPLHPLEPLNGANEKNGALVASIGMLFIPGPEELEGMRLLSREQLLAEITNPSLRRIVSALYREAATVGDGSTAAAVEHELATGQPVGGRWHSIKARESISALRRILREQNLSPREEVIARYILSRTERAFGFGGPI